MIYAAKRLEKIPSQHLVNETTKMGQLSSVGDHMPRDFISVWPLQDLQDLIEEAAASIDPSLVVFDQNDPEGLFVYTANEAGVVSDFRGNIATCIGRILSKSNDHDLSTVRFADFQTAGVNSDGHFPDQIIVGTENGLMTIRCVGLFKTHWSWQSATQTPSLPDIRVLADKNVLGQFLNLLGRLKKYMQQFDVKLGFLSTYESSVFVRRVGPYEFQVTPPINRTDTNPSVLQCYHALCFASRNTQDCRRTFEVDDKLFRLGPNARVGTDRNAKIQTRRGGGGDDSTVGGAGSGAAGGSTGGASRTLKRQKDPPTSTTTTTTISSSLPSIVTARTVFLEAEESNYALSIGEQLSKSKFGRSVYKAIELRTGEEVIFKFWPMHLKDAYQFEIENLEHLKESAFVPKMRHSGHLLLHSCLLLPDGYGCVTNIERGKSLTERIVQEMTNSERLALSEKLLVACQDVIDFGFYQRDLRLENILYDPNASPSVKLIDLESFYFNDYEYTAEDMAQKFLGDYYPE